eukprot:m.80990 g.80990  ORF g.80990 m.80990 type:complete len:105 (+) comp16318_c0_seq7:3922-4236(+)
MRFRPWPQVRLVHTCTYPVLQPCHTRAHMYDVFVVSVRICVHIQKVCVCVCVHDVCDVFVVRLCVVCVCMWCVHVCDAGAEPQGMRETTATPSGSITVSSPQHR